MFRRSLDTLLERRCTASHRRSIGDTRFGYDEMAWRDLADMGALGAFLPEDVGGAGASGLWMMAAMEAFGTSLFVSPFLWSSALTASLLPHNTPLGRTLLASMAQCGAVMTTALHEPDARYEWHTVRTQAVRDGNTYRISGKKCLVPFAVGAERIVVPARTSGAPTDWHGVTLFAIKPNATGVALRSYQTSDGGRAADLELTEVVADHADIVGRLGEGSPALERAIDFAMLAQAAETVGHMRSLLKATVEHCNTREQFGVKIGSFQALRHRMVDMFAVTETAAAFVQAALAAVASPGHLIDPAEATSVKLTVDAAARLVAHEAVQLHGGMGMADESAVSHHFRRLTAISLTFADRGKLLERYRVTLSRGAVEEG